MEQSPIEKLINDISKLPGLGRRSAQRIALFLLKNKDTLIIDSFKFKCCIGKKGLTKKKVEGDKKTPKGEFKLGNLYFRNDRNNRPETSLKTIILKKNMGWCDDVNSKKYYNKLINIKSKVRHEKLFRRDFKYDYLIHIKYNCKKNKLGKGSAIFMHCSFDDLRNTNGCVALKKNNLKFIINNLQKINYIYIR